jgi:thioredoxin-dependent peroxiredoxin
MKLPVSLGLAAVVLAVLSIAVIRARAADDTTMPAEGQKAPGFTLPSQDGSPISLDQYHGKWVVLYFYPKDMTTGCTIEAHKFQDALPQLEAKNAVVLGVSVDNQDSHKQFCAKDGLTFHLLADTDHKVVGEYGSLGGFGGMVMAQRNTFLIDPKGNIAKVWVKVNPNNAASDVLAALP